MNMNMGRPAAHTLATLGPLVEDLKRRGQRVIFTNGCFDVLHAGHVALLEQARALGDFLVVGLNSDASVRRLKGPSRPIHDEGARASVLSALRPVDAVVIFDENTPVETIAALRPSIHVKGGDYDPESLPETPVVRAGGGAVVILPLVDGYSTTRAVTLSAAKPPAPARIVIPARFGSTRFPGKPLAELGGKPVIVRVVEAALQTSAERPILVATDDGRIFAAVERAFPRDQALPVMTSPNCHTGTDRIAEVVRGYLLNPDAEARSVVVNLQGDEPFVAAEHVTRLIDTMRADPALRMATLATPVTVEEQIGDPNVVKVTLDARGRALYFSRATIPYDREQSGVLPLRHLGIYAYEANWLLEMAALPPSPLEEIEKLEQLRALEHGVEIGVAVVENVVPIAIDTPADLERARAHWAEWSRER